MENYFFKVEPTRTFTDQANITRTVVGIAARITSNIAIGLFPQTDFSFWVEFLLETGTKFGGMNVKTSEFAARAVLAGATQEDADAAINQIVKGLVFGTTEQQYAAATGLAGMYGYGLAPIEEQNGDPLYVAPVEPEPESEPENPE